IETYFQNKKEEKAQYILKKLVGAGVYISSSGLTNRILIMAVATMICQTSRFNTVVYGRINRARSLVLKGSVTATAVVLNVYGLIQDAANSADNLKMHNSFYYNALYANHLEMMYFLIEPVITGVVWGWCVFLLGLLLWVFCVWGGGGGGMMNLLNYLLN
ncbi:hypothetical protein ACQ7A4_28385, partial [Klebsiella pneumoniae]